MDNSPTMDRIVKLEQRVTAAEHEWDAAKDLAKACKEAFDNAVAELRHEIRREREPELGFEVDKQTGEVSVTLTRVPRVQKTPREAS